MSPVPDLTTYRSAQYNFKGYLFLLSPKIVWSGTVAAPISWPVTSLTVLSTITGSLSDANVDQTVVFGLAPHGTDQGFSRVRLASGGSTLYIGKSAQGAGRYGDLNLLSDCYAEIWDDYRVWAKIPYIDPSGQEFKDGTIAAGTYPSNHVPIAQAGVGYAGFVDLSNIITVQFVGGYLLDNLASSSSILWDIVDGTLASGSLTSFNMTATFPPGFRWVRLIITVNGNTDIAVVPVLAAERTGVNAPITIFKVSSPDKLYADRHEIGFEINYPLPATIYPYGTLAMMWEDEWYNGTKGSLYNSDAPPGREHMKFIGWIDEEPNARKATKTGGTDSVTLNCIDVAGRLKKLPGFSQTLTYNPSPTTWYQWSDLTIDSYLASLIYWQTTATKLANFTWSGIFYPVTNLISDGKQDFHSQFDKLAGAICFALTTDQWGRLAINPDPNLQLSRTNAVQLAANDNDYGNLTFSGTPYPKVAWLHSSAIVASNSAVVPVFCDAPGQSPGQGPADQTVGNRLVQSLFELLIQEGHRYAALNAPIGPITLPLIRPGDVGINPGFMTWITLNAAPFLRLFNISSNRLLPIERDTTYTYSKVGVTKKVSVKAIVETVGLPAVQYIPPVNALPNSIGPAVVNPIDPTQYIIAKPGTGQGPNNLPNTPNSIPSDGNAAPWIRNNKVYVSRDFLTGNTTAKDITPTGAYTFVGIADNPNVSANNELYVLGNDGANSYVWHTVNAFAATVVWTISAAIIGIYQDIRELAAPGSVAIYSANPIPSGVVPLAYNPFGAGGSGPSSIAVGTPFDLTLTPFSGVYNGGVIFDVCANITVISTTGLTPGAGFNSSVYFCDGTVSNATGYQLGSHLVATIYGGNSTTPGHMTLQIDSLVALVAFSTDHGATFPTIIPVGTSPGLEGGFDTNELQSSSLAATNNQANYATTVGGTFTPDPNGAAASSPLCLEAPWFRLGSNSVLNGPGQPDYLMMLATGLFKILAGLAAVNITPSGATGVACNNAITTWRGTTFAVIMAVSGVTHVFTSTNTGASWTDRGAFANAVYIRFRRVGGSGVQLFLAHGTGISYSANLGASWTTISLPGSGNVIAVEGLG